MITIEPWDMESYTFISRTYTEDLYIILDKEIVKNERMVLRFPSPRT